MNMKKVLVLMCVAWMGAGAFAFTMLGPPTAELEKTTRRNEKKKKVSTFEDRHGYVFSFAEMDIGIDGIGTLEDIELTRHYYTWGIALDENFNFNVLLGAASGEADSDISEISDFDGDTGFSAGFNFKSTFYHGETVDWGAMVQMTYFSTEDTLDVDIPDFWTGSANVELDDAYDLQIAVGPTVDISDWVGFTDCWKIYGGAYYYMLEGDLDISASGAGSATFDVDEEDDFGGFIGTQIDIWKNIDLIVEYSMGEDSSNIGLSVGATF